MRDFDAATNESDSRRNETNYNENVLEWIDGDKYATVSFSQGRYVTRIRKLAEEHPDDVKIIRDYGNGILAHIPTRYIKIGAPRKVSEEQRAAMSERFKALRSSQT